MIGDHRRRNESRQLDPAVAVGRAHHGYLNALVAPSGDAPCPLSFDHGLAFELEAELAKEVDRRHKVVDDNAYMVHPPKRHVSVLQRHVLIPRVWPNSLDVRNPVARRGEQPARS